MKRRRRITINLRVSEAQNLLGHLQDSFSTNGKRDLGLRRTKSRLLFQFQKLKAQTTGK